MQINNGTNSIVEKTRFLCDADSDSYPEKDIIREVNNGLDRISSIIIGSDRNWHWDDSNYSDEPRGLTDLNQGQQQYTFDDTFLVLRDVVIKDEDDNFRKLDPINVKHKRQAPQEYYKDNGTPQEYDKQGPSIYLYPAPDYDKSSGLIVYFQRTADKFETGDTTKSPGFASFFHDYLAYVAAETYCMKYKQERVEWLQQMQRLREQQVAEHYTQRWEDEPAQVQTMGIIHR